jgi:hypothetical protein
MACVRVHVVLAKCRQIIQSEIRPLFALLLLLSFNELQGFLPRHHANRTRFPLETDAIAFLCHKKHLWSESGADKLTG